jgi:type I restriction enzyme S subunit
MPEVITNNLELWSSTLLTKSTAGRGSNGKQEAYGVKKLRELILELAVRGKLVAQDPNDEPASLLLENIAKEKARLRIAGEGRKEKTMPDIGENEMPYRLPPGWEWVRFGTIAQHNSGKTLDRGRNAGELRDYITTSNLYWGRFDLDNIRQMPIADDELERCTAKRGDLLICEGGESGRAAVWPYDHEVCFQNHVHRARLYGEIDPYFSYRFFEKLNATGEIDQHRKGVGISNMSSKALASIVMPLPPLAEQHRIVAKVDELMALCDQLEQQQTHSLEAHQTLVETLLGTLTNSSVRPEPVEGRASTARQARSSAQTELEEAWTRIANHFDTLFTTEHSIDQFKQTILQLAVMGKLVTQDSTDEPAEVLLVRVKAAREQLIVERDIGSPSYFQ